MAEPIRSPMQRRTANNLSTSLYNEDTGETLIRVSRWANAEDIEIEEDIPDKPTLKVRVQSGRGYYFGTIDRAAWKHWKLQDNPAKRPVIPVPADGGRPSARDAMYR